MSEKKDLYTLVKEKLAKKEEPTPQNMVVEKPETFPKEEAEKIPSTAANMVPKRVRK